MMRAWLAVLVDLTSDRDRIVQQPVRERLMRLIGRQPGIHVSAICRETGEAWGTVQYHLGLLQESALISSMEVGRARRFFPHDMDEDRVRLVGIIQQGRREQIARYIQEHPGRRQVDVCKALGISRKTFRASIVALMDAQLIQEQRGLQTNRYYPRPSLEEMLDQDGGRKPDLLDII